MKHIHVLQRGLQALQITHFKTQVQDKEKVRSTFHLQ